MKTFRKERLAAVIREEIATMLIQGQIKDPRLSGFITITEVRCTKDLRFATIYVSVMGSDTDREKTLTALTSAVGFIKNQLSPKLTIRWMPELRFKIDDSLERGHNMLQKIKALNPDEEKATDQNDTEENHGPEYPS